MPGKKCPLCKKMTLHDHGTHLRCSNDKCEAVFFDWKHPAEANGQGQGLRCPNCENQTLHVIVQAHDNEYRGCSKCPTFSARPLPDVDEPGGAI